LEPTYLTYSALSATWDLDPILEELGEATGYGYQYAPTADQLESFRRYVVQATKKAEALLGCPLFPRYDTRTMEMRARCGYLPLGGYLCALPDGVGKSLGVDIEPEWFTGETWHWNHMTPDKLLAGVDRGLFLVRGWWGVLDLRYSPVQVTLDGGAVQGASALTITENNYYLTHGDVLVDTDTGCAMVVAGDVPTGDKSVVLDAWGTPDRDVAAGTTLTSWGCLNETLMEFVATTAVLDAHAQLFGGHRSGLKREKADKHEYERFPTSSPGENLTARWEDLELRVMAMKPSRRPL